MKLTVNDSEIEVGEDTTVAALLAEMDFPVKGVAVAVNWAVLPRSQWDSVLPDGAHVEVVTAVQGG